MPDATARIFLLTVLLFATVSNPLAATYDSSTSKAYFPAIYDGVDTYTEAVITLNANGTYTLDGNKSELPFRCDTVFDDNTPALLNEGMSVEEINGSLGCRWSSYSAIANTVTSGGAYSWVDKNCTSLTLTVSPTFQTQLNQSLTYVSSCTLNPDGGGLYDLSADNFFINRVIIDDSVAATNVLLRFDTEMKTYDVISAVSESMANPPEICPLFSQDLLTTTLSTVNTAEEVVNALGCQWTYNIVTPNGVGSGSYNFWDHECNNVFAFIDKSTGQLTGIQLGYRKTGCGF